VSGDTSPFGAPLQVQKKSKKIKKKPHITGSDTSRSAGCGIIEKNRFI